MSKEKMNEEMDEKQVLALIEELRKEIIYDIRRFEEILQKTATRESRDEEAIQEKDSEKKLQMLSESYEGIKKEVSELRILNGKFGVAAKIQQLKDIYESATNPRVKENAYVALLVVAVKYKEIKF